LDEAALVRRFAVSRTPVREAVRCRDIAAAHLAADD